MVVVHCAIDDSNRIDDRCTKKTVVVHKISKYVTVDARALSDIKQQAEAEFMHKYQQGSLLTAYATCKEGQ